MTGVNPQTIFPLIKSADWAEKRELLFRPFIEGRMVQSERLAVVFVVDTKEQLAYLPQGFVMTQRNLHTQAANCW